MQPIQIGNFNYSRDEKGNWLWKANEVSPVIKKDNPVYKEKPHFELQNEIEGNSKNNFNKVVSATVIEVTKFLKENLQ